jgi:hypothetical protein
LKMEFSETETLQLTVRQLESRIEDLERELRALRLALVPVVPEESGTSSKMTAAAAAKKAQEKAAKAAAKASKAAAKEAAKASKAVAAPKTVAAPAKKVAMPAPVAAKADTSAVAAPKTVAAPAKKVAMPAPVAAKADTSAVAVTVEDEMACIQGTVYLKKSGGYLYECDPTSEAIGAYVGKLQSDGETIDAEAPEPAE